MRAISTAELSIVWEDDIAIVAISVFVMWQRLKPEHLMKRG